MREHAKRQNESVNAFIVRSVSETMERDQIKFHDDATSLKPEPTPPKVDTAQTPEPPHMPDNKQAKTYMPFTEEAARRIDLLELATNVMYQAEIMETFGMDVLAVLMDKARQKAAEHEAAMAAKQRAAEEVKKEEIREKTKRKANLS